MKYELVWGLETHVELSTKTKIFCGCTTEFGGDQNTHCCPGCLALPGALPVLNKRVVEYGIKAGLAANSEIARISKMDRKNYCYPDLPSAYQITQNYAPLCIGGYIELSNGRKIRIAGMFINSPLWIIYDIIVGSWAGILDEIVTEASMILSIYRYGWKNLDVVDR